MGLQALAHGVAKKRKAGMVQAHGTGSGGSGYNPDTTVSDQGKCWAARKVFPISSTGIGRNLAHSEDLRLCPPPALPVPGIEGLCHTHA